MEKKGNFIALVPPYGGLPSRVAVKNEKEHFYVSWLIDETIESPGAKIECSEVQTICRLKPTEIVINRTTSLPVSISSNKGGDTLRQSPVTPLLNPSEWCPPTPTQQMDHHPSININKIEQLLHLIPNDPLRPGCNFINFQPNHIYAGDEVNFARLEMKTDLSVAVPPILFQKLPKVKLINILVTHERLYLALDSEEIRVVNVRPVVSKLIEAMESCLFYPINLLDFDDLKSFLTPFKIASKLSDRRMVDFSKDDSSINLTINGVTSKIPFVSSHINSESSDPIKLDGNRLLKLLKNWEGKDISIYYGLSSRSTLLFTNNLDYVEVLYPMIQVN